MRVWVNESGCEWKSGCGWETWMWENEMRVWMKVCKWEKVQGVGWEYTWKVWMKKYKYKSRCEWEQIWMRTDVNERVDEREWMWIREWVNESGCEWEIGCKKTNVNENGVNEIAVWMRDGVNRRTNKKKTWLERTNERMWQENRTNKRVDKKVNKRINVRECNERVKWKNRIRERV